MRAYRNMLSRVSGVQIKKAHLYKDKEILSKNDFYEFSINDESFHKMFDAWELSGYDRRLSPSVDRIDSKKGYSIENIRWIEHWINSRNGTLSRYGKTDNIIDDKK